MGNEQVTVQNLDVVQVDEELGLIAVRRRHPRPQGRRGLCEEHRQDQRGEEGHRDRPRQPAEGFRPCQPAEGFRPQQVRKGEIESCLKRTLYDMAGKQIGEIELSEAIFGIEPNVAVVHDVVKNHLANCRQAPRAP